VGVDHGLPDRDGERRTGVREVRRRSWWCRPTASSRGRRRRAVAMSILPFERSFVLLATHRYLIPSTRRGRGGGEETERNAEKSSATRSWRYNALRPARSKSHALVSHSAATRVRRPRSDKGARVERGAHDLRRGAEEQAPGVWWESGTKLRPAALAGGSTGNAQARRNLTAAPSRMQRKKKKISSPAACSSSGRKGDSSGRARAASHRINRPVP